MAPRNRSNHPSRYPEADYQTAAKQGLSLNRMARVFTCNREKLRDHIKEMYPYLLEQFSENGRLAQHTNKFTTGVHMKISDFKIKEIKRYADEVNPLIIYCDYEITDTKMNETTVVKEVLFPKSKTCIVMTSDFCDRVEIR